jgi:hypothetical protein
VAVRIQWDEHEQAVLLRALINVLDQKTERKTAICEVSEMLRNYATMRGIAIDDKYRNENGITLQMSKLEYAFTNGRSGLRVDSGWYFSIVQTYRNNYERYMELLGETMEASTSGTINHMDFSKWIKKNNPREAEKILASLIVLGNQKHTNILKNTDTKEIESLIDTIRSKKGGRKKRYIEALKLYRDYLYYVQGKTTRKDDSEEVSIPKEESRVVDEVILPGNEEKAEDIVSFTGSQNYSYTRPSDLEYFGTHYPVKNWKQVYVRLVKCLFDDYPDKISALRGKSVRGNGRVDIADTSGSDAMIAPREIAEGLYLETNESAADIVRKSGILLKICNIDYEDVRITYASSHNEIEGDRTVSEDNDKEKWSDQQGNLSFYEWIVQVQGMAEGTGRSYDSAINTADIFAKEHNIGNGSLRETGDLAAISEMVDSLFQSEEFIEINLRQHNRFRAALRKYKEYLSGGGGATREAERIQNVVKDTFDDVDFTPYRVILTEKFPRGFRIESRLDMKRFRAFWNDRYGTGPTDDDETIRKRIAHITIRCQDFVYLPEMMASDETKKRIFAYIDDCFREGKAAVYFDALYNEFQTEFVGIRINNSDMLKSYLSFENNGKYYFHKGYLTADESTEVNPAEEIRDYMVFIGVPITMDDLKEALSHIDPDTVFWTVAGHDSGEFVRNRKGEYFHADIIHFTQSELSTITDMIQRSIDDKGYMGGRELTDAIEIKLPSVTERYPFLSWLGLRDVIAYKLRDLFSFRGKIISAYGQDLSMSDVFAHFASTRDHFTLEQLNSLKRDLDTPIYFDDVYAHSLRISKNDFVSRDQEAFNIEATDNAISRFCTGDYIPLKEVSFFGSFPNAGFPWNGFLLEHYVADFSKKFKLLHIGFNAGIPVGAIVKRSSRYTYFDEVVVTELAYSKIPLNRENALQYLVDIGLLARKNYKGVEQTISKAKLQRQRKG